MPRATIIWLSGVVSKNSCNKPIMWFYIIIVMILCSFSWLLLVLRCLGLTPTKTVPEFSPGSTPARTPGSSSTFDLNNELNEMGLTCMWVVWRAADDKSGLGFTERNIGIHYYGTFCWIERDLNMFIANFPLLSFFLLFHLVSRKWLTRFTHSTFSFI